jgi:hypothetical protein
VLLGALAATCGIFGGLGLIQLIPEGAVKHVAEIAFRIVVFLFIFAMIIVALNARVGRAEDEGWNQ